MNEMALDFGCIIITFFFYGDFDHEFVTDSPIRHEASGIGTGTLTSPSPVKVPSVQILEVQESRKQYATSVNCLSL